jgi:VanZ family protein
MTASFWRYQAPAIAYAIGLFWASSLSRLPLPNIGLALQDKLIHGLAYAGFSFVIYRALAYPRPLTRYLHTGTILLGIGYAVTDEVHQLFVPGRQAEIFDLAADILGILLVQFAIYIIHRRQSG